MRLKQYRVVVKVVRYLQASIIAPSEEEACEIASELDEDKFEELVGGSWFVTEIEKRPWMEGRDAP